MNDLDFLLLFLLGTLRRLGLLLSSLEIAKKLGEEAGGALGDILLRFTFLNKENKS